MKDQINVCNIPNYEQANLYYDIWTPLNVTMFRRIPVFKFSGRESLEFVLNCGTLRCKSGGITWE